MSDEDAKASAAGAIWVADYDPRWPVTFEAIRSAIAPQLAGVAVAIEHVGSTAVPGLCAKPVIDVDVVVPDQRVADGIARLTLLGYTHRGDLGIPQREAFAAPAHAPKHHLYLCPQSSLALANHLAIRDHLRAHPALASEYGALKKQLAARHPHDISAYVEGKTAFLVTLLRAHGFADESLAEIERINQRPKDAPIHLVPYDAAWPAQFEIERAQLARVLQPWMSGAIEHVGSTAVPGLCAKPVIDIMAGIEGLAASRAAIDVLRAHGYQYAAYRTDVMHWFCKPDFSFRTHHLHLVPFASDLWHARIAFRNHLRASATAAAEYARLKQELAARHPFDREAYTEGKSGFVARVLRDGLAR